MRGQLQADRVLFFLYVANDLSIRERDGAMCHRVALKLTISTRPHQCHNDRDTKNNKCRQNYFLYTFFKHSWSQLLNEARTFFERKSLE